MTCRQNKFALPAAVLLACALLQIVQPSFAYAEADLASMKCRVSDIDLQGDYRGACKNGLADGKGSASGNAFYEGGFREGRKHGRGRWMLPNGDFYTGEFNLDLPHGAGLYQWRGDSSQKGNRYLGDFHFGKKHGYGVLVTADGDRYEGLWKDDARGGQTATEIQFQRRYLAQTQAIQVGGRVCRDHPFGIGSTLMISGKVEAVRGSQLRISLDPMHRRELGLPEIIDDESIMDWLPCQASH
jgi:hypothetical protein